MKFTLSIAAAIVGYSTFVTAANAIQISYQEIDGVPVDENGQPLTGLRGTIAKAQGQLLGANFGPQGMGLGEGTGFGNFQAFGQGGLFTRAPHAEGDDAYESQEYGSIPDGKGYMQPNWFGAGGAGKTPHFKAPQKGDWGKNYGGHNGKIPMQGDWGKDNGGYGGKVPMKDAWGKNNGGHDGKIPVKGDGVQPPSYGYGKNGPGYDGRSWTPKKVDGKDKQNVWGGVYARDASENGVSGYPWYAYPTEQYGGGHFPNIFQASSNNLLAQQAAQQNALASQAAQQNSAAALQAHAAEAAQNEAQASQAHVQATNFNQNQIYAQNKVHASSFEADQANAAQKSAAMKQADLQAAQQEQQRMAALKAEKNAQNALLQASNNRIHVVSDRRSMLRGTWSA